MATRGTIAVEHEDGSISQVYVHWDMYLGHAGNILRKHYATLGSVEELVKLGNLSSLGIWIHPDGAHSHKHPEEDVCVFYGRDRGDKNQEAARFQNYNEYLLEANFEEYNYIFRNGQWYVSCEYAFPGWIGIVEAFEIEAAAEAE